MSFATAKVARPGAVLALLICACCAGNTAGDGASSMTGSNGPSTPGPTSTPNMPNDGNNNSGTDPNTNSGTNPNGSSRPGGASCTAMPGPCSTTLTAIALTGCSSADYKAQVTLGGTQVLSMLVDTGSTTIAAADSACSDCQGVTPTYTPGSRARDDNTTVGSAYGTGNGWSGITVTDTVQLTPAVKAVNMRFGRVTKQTSTSSGVSFFSGSDCAGNVTDNAQQGIFGMGNAADAIAGTDTYLDILKASGQVNDAFAFEACDSGGRMWLGGYDPNSVSAAPVFTPLDTTQGYDIVTLSSIAIGGTKLSLSPSDFGQTLVDTGTSIFLLPTAAFDTLTSSIEADPNYSGVLPQGFLASSQFIKSPAPQAQLDAQLPPMHLIFPGVNNGAAITVDLPASESYLTPFMYNGEAGYLSGLSPISSKPVTTILGNSTMHSHVLIFDRANKQLGYGPHSTCPSGSP